MLWRSLSAIFPPWQPCSLQQWQRRLPLATFLTSTSDATRATRGVYIYHVILSIYTQCRIYNYTTKYAYTAIGYIMLHTCVYTASTQWLHFTSVSILCFYCIEALFDIAHGRKLRSTSASLRWPTHAWAKAYTVLTNKNLEPLKTVGHLNKTYLTHSKTHAMYKFAFTLSKYQQNSMKRYRLHKER